MQTATIVIAVIAIVIIVAGVGYLMFGTNSQPRITNTTVSTQSTSIPQPTSSVTSSVNASASTTSSSSTTSINTTIAPQSKITGNYIMAFLACDTLKYNCMQTFNHETYLAQSENGKNWSLVPSFTPFNGSVPDIVKRGDTLYIYTPNYLVRYNTSTGAESSPMQVVLRYQNGTYASGPNLGGFVDPSPILTSNGSIILFYLPGIIGQDPAGCPTGQTSCVKHIMSATEVSGSNGTAFVIDNGTRASIQISGVETASDPSIFSAPNGYILYISQGPSTLAYSSPQLLGNFTPIHGLSNGMLVQNSGGVPSGMYNSATGNYWTYVTDVPQSGVGKINLAITSNLNSSIPSSAFTTVVSGCMFNTLGCSYTVESPGVIPNN